MNYPHLHMMLNHFPVVGAIVALLLLSWALITRRRELIRLSLVVTLFVGLSAYPAFFTGDEAHEQLEDVQGFDHDLIDDHEDAADLALWALLATAGIAALGLWVSRKEREVPRWAGAATIAALIFSTTVVARTALLGGEIRHPEATGPLWAPPDVSKSVLLDSASTGDGQKHKDRDRD
jgi:cytochrome bd-type quinol oxidase subunit 1